MDSHNNICEVIYYRKDDEYRVDGDFCDEHCIERFFKIHPKSQTHTNNIRKRENDFKESHIYKYGLLL